jgi:transcriptional regulator with XRE-family HTH domain
MLYRFAKGTPVDGLRGARRGRLREEGWVMAAEQAEASEMGRRLRQARLAREKSLKVIAGLAGISESHLSNLEHGRRALDRRSLVKKLADALEIAPTDITSGATIGTPGELEEDRDLQEVRLAMLGVTMGEPLGEVLPVEALRLRMVDVLTAQRDCDYVRVGAQLPSLIRDLHTTLDAHRDEREVLRMLALTHVQCTQAWLMDIGASIDLGWQAAVLAKAAADQLGEPMSQGVTAFGRSFGLLSAGAFPLAARVLAEPEVGTATSEAMQMSGMLALTSSLVAAARGDQGDRVSALEYATDLAEHVGDDGNAMWLGFGPSNVGVWRMSVALEAGEHAEAAHIATTINPTALPSPTRQSAYWREYGRALAHLPRRQNDAVRMLRRAEQISPVRIHRHPFMRSILTELNARTKDPAARRELRGMMYRAGLPT